MKDTEGSLIPHDKPPALMKNSGKQGQARWKPVSMYHTANQFTGPDWNTKTGHFSEYWATDFLQTLKQVVVECAEPMAPPVSKVSLIPHTTLQGHFSPYWVMCEIRGKLLNRVHKMRRALDGHLVSYKNTADCVTPWNRESIHARKATLQWGSRSRAAAWHSADPLTPGSSGRISAWQGS